MNFCKSRLWSCFVLAGLTACFAQAQDSTTDTNQVTSSGGLQTLAEDIVAVYKQREELFRENSFVARYRGLSHDWTSVIDIATKGGKVAFKAEFDRGGSVRKQEAVFDGADTLIRLDHGIRANAGNAMNGVDLEDYLTAFNGCRLPNSRIHPDKDRFPDYTVVELIESGKLTASASADGVQLQGDGVTLLLDPNRQYVITKASYAYPEDVFMDIESTEFMQAKEKLWIATHFTAKWRAREDPFFEITVDDIAWSVPDERFHFLVKDRENVEDFRPYDGVSPDSVLVYTGSADPKLMQQARDEAVVQAKAVAAITARRSLSRWAIWGVNIAIVLVTVVVILRHRRATGG